VVRWDDSAQGAKPEILSGRPSGPGGS